MKLVFYLKWLLSRNNVRIFFSSCPTSETTDFRILLVPTLLICAKIVGMDKIIKTISESGAFRAYVLDIQKPYEQPKKNIIS